MWVIKPVFRSTKDLPRKTEFFCMRYFWRTNCKSTKKITEQYFSCQNKSVWQKLAWSCKKRKSTKKTDIHTFDSYWFNFYANVNALFLENELQIDQKNYGILFMSKQVSLAKVSLILQKEKIGQKNRYTPFWFLFIPFLRDFTPPKIKIKAVLSQLTALY